MRIAFTRFTNFRNAISDFTRIIKKAADFFLISIQRKLVFVFLMFIILPILILSIISYIMMQEKVKEKVNTANYASMQQAEINVERIFSDMLTASNTLILDDDINNILKNLENENSIEFYADSMEVVKKMSNVQSSVLDYYRPSAIQIMDKRGHAYTTLFRQGDGESDQFTQLLREEVGDQSGNYLKWGELLHKFDFSVGTGPSNSIVLMRSYFDISTALKTGDIMIIIPETQFSSILKKLAVFNGAKAYLVNNNGMIISATDENELGSKLQYYQLINKSSTNSPILIKSNGRIETVNVQSIDRNGWKLVMEIPEDVLFSEFSAMRNRIIYIDIAFLLLFLVISFLMARSIANPINRLNIASKEIASGNLSARVAVSGRDEVKQLASSFNHMASDLERMMKQINEDERTKRELELDVLYAQINPHFLFNTLNSIRWMADASKVFNVSKMIIALTNLLRSSILRKDEVITIREEIENVKNYILIQKMRFASAFEDEYDIAEEILDCRTLKLILQPIVENSIIHGFAGISYKGIIRITGRLIDNRIIIVVSDNGIGIDDETIEKILRNKSNRNGYFSGIGISNVSERLVLHFGSEFALKVEGTPGEGTNVLMNLPILTKEAGHVPGVDSR